MERYVTELDDVIRYFDLDSYHLLGHSFGGCIVLKHGLKYTAGLQSLILSSALINVKDWLAGTNIRKQELPHNVQVAIEKHEVEGTTDSEEYQDAIKIFNSKFLCRLDHKPPVYRKALDNFNLDLYKVMWGF